MDLFVSFSRRKIVALAVTAVLAAGILGAAVALDNPGARDPLTADQVYDDSMTLEEVAAAATGKPGEIAPPCPQEDVVQQLKQTNLEFGPCDPFPEKGQGVLLTEVLDPAEAPGAETARW